MTNQVIEKLERSNLQYEVLPHPRTESAAAEARAVGVESRQVAKTVVLASEGGYIRAVVPASERLDLQKVRARLGGAVDVRLASESELGGAYPSFEIGAIPPFAGPAGDRVVVDRQLAELPEVVLEAGTHSHSVKLRTPDLLRLSGADIADIAAG